MGLMRNSVYRHRGRESDKESELCANECKGVSHVFWECLTCSSRAAFS